MKMGCLQEQDTKLYGGINLDRRKFTMEVLGLTILRSESNSDGCAAKRCVIQ